MSWRLAGRPRRQRVHLCGTPQCRGHRCPTGPPLLRLTDDEPTVLEELLTPEPLPVPASPEVVGTGSHQRQRRVVHEWGAA